MPITPTYPGVYVEELPSGVRAIAGVSTSVTAFIGRARRGPSNRATLIHSYSDYERLFGGLWRNSPMSYAVQQYFLNGGVDAVIVRVYRNATAAQKAVSPITLEAASPGAWGNDVSVTVDHNTKDRTEVAPDPLLFNLTVVDGTTGAREVFLNVSMDPTSERFVTDVLKEQSSLVRTSGLVSGNRPAEQTEKLASGTDGDVITDAEIKGNAAPPKTGLYALDEADIFTLLSIPPYHYDPGKTGADPTGDVWSAAISYARRRRAVVLVDPPIDWTSKDKVDFDKLGFSREDNAALYFPRIVLRDPLQDGRLSTFAPSGAVAGVIARTDGQRGIWKAPAGIEATLAGVADVSVPLTDAENGDFNPLGINCLRSLPVIGKVVWGARTLRGADRLADQWKYLPIRRLAYYIEESLYRGTQWAVFEPNDEPLWSQIRLNLGAFMHGLFRQGAFQGSSPRDAYFVKCDAETTTQTDRDLGIVNIVVGFAPLKPAEFVILKIQQMAGKIET